MSYTYVIIDKDERPDGLWRAKIGKANNPIARRQQLQTGCADWEPMLHNLFASSRVGGEWFALEAHELLTLADLAEIGGVDSSDYESVEFVGSKAHQDNNHSHAWYVAFENGEEYATGYAKYLADEASVAS